MKRPTTLAVVSVGMVLTAIGTLVFWITFLADLEAQRTGYPATQSAGWFAWELSFPLADGWMAATALAGGIGLWRRRPAGLLTGLVSGGAMVFLGLMDGLFFLQNELYLPLTGEVAVELAIHLWMIGFGLLSIGAIWQHRADLIDCQEVVT